MQITKNSVVSFHYTLNDADGQLNTPLLVREAVTDSGRDNTTAVVVEIL
jgi:FKBP-type peptidyl-prolyl cis-trans isomerase 2